MTLTVPEAPVCRPTAQEFEDPLGYISSIQASAAAAGIAKIIPPPGAQCARLEHAPVALPSMLGHFDTVCQSNEG